GGIRVLGAGHRDYAALMWAVVELGLDGMARPTGTPTGFLIWVLGERIPALNHEALHNAVKGGTVVKAFLGQGLEILDRLRGDIGPKLDGHFACGCFDNGSFVRH